MEGGFDVMQAREFYERQRKDAERIVMLCDASAKLHQENEALKAELIKCKADSKGAENVNPK